jgi:hypothetical protein
VERPLQLPSTPQRRRRPTASIAAQHRRHQRPALIQLCGCLPADVYPPSWLRPRCTSSAVITGCSRTCAFSC